MAHEAMSIPLIYVDEGGFSEDMPRPCGDRSLDRRRAADGGSVRLRHKNADVLLLRHAQYLLPALPSKAALAMASASFHESEKIRNVVEAAGCLPEYPPPHSPDLDPAERKWTQAKALGRKLGCSADELFQQPVLQSFYYALAISYCFS